MTKTMWLTCGLLCLLSPGIFANQPCKTRAEFKVIQTERTQFAATKVKARTEWSVIFKGFQVEKTKEHRIEYSPYGDEVRRIEFYANGLIRYQSDLTVDDSGRILTSQIRFQGKPRGQWLYEYNSQGMIKADKYIDTSGAVTSWVFYQYLDTSKILLTCSDSMGQTVYAITYSYDGHRDSGILIESTRELSGGKHDATALDEFSDGRWIAETTLNRDKRTTKTIRHAYDEHGRIEKTTTVNGFGEKVNEITNRYSSKGLLEQVETRDGLGYLKSRIQYDYEFYD